MGMTREEAIKILQYACKNTKSEIYPKEKEAWIMAIKALEQQTCEDCVTKKIVLDMLEDINIETEGVGFYYEHYVDYIKNLPSVTPQPKDAIKVIERNLCDSCTNRECIFQSGIVRNHCDFYKTESEE